MTFNNNKLYEVLGINDDSDLKKVSKDINIPISMLRYYNDKHIIPLGMDLEKVLEFTQLSVFELQLKLGLISIELTDLLSKQAGVICNGFERSKNNIISNVLPVFDNNHGRLYKGDCLNVLKNLQDNSVNMVFADPPFNLNKNYGTGIDDDITQDEYLLWCEKWIKECVRVLKPGGAFFIYNLPFWNTYISGIMNQYLSFRHWIAVSMKGLVPVANKLQPEHYSLLYYIKGEKPLVYNKQRIPLNTCRHCGGEIRDYGGKKSELDPNGISVSDIFMDINPVRHKKFKNRNANELPLKLMYRIISLSTNVNDIVLDPFGGAGTTYVAAEYLDRHWIGAEIGDTDVIINRIKNNSTDIDVLKKIQEESNVLFTEKQIKLRKSNGYWGYEILK